MLPLVIRASEGRVTPNLRNRCNLRIVSLTSSHRNRGAALSQFKLPSGVNERLQNLLDRRDNGELLTDNERREAEGLVDLAEFLSLLRSNRVQTEFDSKYDSGNQTRRSKS